MSLENYFTYPRYFGQPDDSWIFFKLSDQFAAQMPIFA